LSVGRSDFFKSVRYDSIFHPDTQKEKTMSKLIVEVCPETGICSILKSDGSGKVDLMPDEAAAIRAAGGDAATIREVIFACDPSFADALAADQIGQISKEI